MSHLSQRPAGRLRGIVERIWLVDEAGPRGEPDTICPDGRTEIVLHLADPMSERDGSHTRRQPRHLLVGQMSRPIVVVPTGRIAMAGATLAPGALHRLLPCAQHRLAEHILDLESVWGVWTRECADRLDAARSAAERLAAFERALDALIPPEATSSTTSLDRVVAAFDAGGGLASIDRLALALGISRRQFERRFHEHVGLPPRLFGRIVRFQRAFRALGTARGADVAARCGYVDQAHMIHEMRRFAGTSPTRLADSGGLTAFFRG